MNTNAEARGHAPPRARSSGTPRPTSLDVRPPPHNLDAEAAVLSDIFLDAARVHDVSGVLKPEHFYSDSNGRIYAAILALVDRGTKVDVVTIADALRADGRLSDVGGPAYLAQIADATPAIAHIDEHARIIVATAKTRQVIAMCQRVAADGYGEVTDANEFASNAAAQISAIAEGTTGEDRFVSTGRELVDAMLDRWNHPEAQEAPMRTGIAQLDRLLRMRRGDLVIVGAHSGIGKSALAHQIASYVATDQGRDGALVFSLEMSGDEVMARMACSAARIDSRAINPENRQASGDEGRRLLAAMETLRTSRLVIDHRANHTPATIRARARAVDTRMRREGCPLRLIVVDYCQIVSPDSVGRGNENREREVAAVGRALKRLAAELNVVVIGVAQLNEDSRQQKRAPRARDLRESRALMQDANAVLLVHNEAAESRIDEEADVPLTPGTADDVSLILAKCRSGRSGTVRARFWPVYCLFG
jgi:replicative DNA helicase